MFVWDVVYDLVSQFAIEAVDDFQTIGTFLSVLSLTNGLVISLYFSKFALAILGLLAMTIITVRAAQYSTQS